ncbi:MAG TPA: cytochrome P450 [Planctomycetaceae bacterium]|nr:cytochrome P450 [Planctomycetaceae bacterium]
MKPDWNPHSDDVQRNQRAAYDDMRERCPVAYSEENGWTLFRHRDVMSVLQDTENFSNAVSQHLSVPSGMDPPEHTAWRALIEKYFLPDAMCAFEPQCRTISRKLIESAVQCGTVEFMAQVALPFAVQVQCAFLGWPDELHDQLINWVRKNHRATLAQDRAAMSEIAREFERLIDDMIEVRQSSDATEAQDITTSLMRDKIWGRTLSNEEIASILRIWTVGEIGTIAASIGILGHFLADQSDIQKQLRKQPSLLPKAIDEILRIRGPLLSNRRIAKAAVKIGGREICEGDRITINWIAANRDPDVFPSPDTFSLDRDPSTNLLYGSGIHVCPGAPLARIEMRVFLEELFAASTAVDTVPGSHPSLAAPPASGFTTLPLRIR